VKLFFDEDMGIGVAEAMLKLGMDAEIARVRKVWKFKDHPEPVPDETWIPWAAYNNYLVISRNTGIIISDSQRQLVADSGLGIVFVPQHLSPIAMFILLYRRWNHLEYLYTKETRPFIYHYPLGKPPRRDSAIPLDYSSIAREGQVQMVAANLRASEELLLSKLGALLRAIGDLSTPMTQEVAASVGPPEPGTQLGFRLLPGVEAKYPASPTPGATPDEQDPPASAEPNSI
jgi:hypothetical protein